MVGVILGSGLSGTFASAEAAISRAGDLPVRLMDSLGASLLQGLLVLKATEMAEMGRGPDEIVSELVFDRPGLLAMANAGPNTNGSQFFITAGAQQTLNGRHTIFGECEELDVVREIAGVERDGLDKPLVAVELRRVTISRG